jgi:transcription initiation factor TFIIIB Brf1 subunit/transcription initiation factor TFIIB
MRSRDWLKAWETAHAIENNLPQPESFNEDFADDGEKDLKRRKIQSCPMCEHEGPMIEDGQGHRLRCSNCGLIDEVIGDDRPKFDSISEAKSYTAEASSRGEAINPLMPHASMSTEIAYRGRLCFAQYQMIKLNRWASLSPLERSLHVVFNKIEKAGTRHKVPSSVQYVTKWLFKRVYEANIAKQKQGKKREGLRGPKRDGLIAACLYMAFKASGLYWTKTRCAMVFEIDLPEIRRGIAIFNELVQEQDLPDIMSKVTGCKQYINWFSIGLKLPRRTTTLCCKLYKLLAKRGIGSSKQPQSIAAACLWRICQTLHPDLTIQKLVSTTGISKATIREVVKIMNGVERPAIAMVFADDMCKTLEITNKITQNKIQNVARALCKIQLDDYYNLWKVACFAIYFVLTVNDILRDEDLILSKCQVKYADILGMARKVVVFKDSIIELYLS